jgi:Fe-S cluster biogenesis protein NfuA
MKILSIDPTPNPAARSFRLDAPIVSGPPIHIEKGSPQAAGNPVADELLGMSDVRFVYLGKDFVTVALAAAEAWSAGEAAIKAALEKALVLLEGKPIESAPPPPPPTDDLLDRINSVLDLRVRPALANDGGGLEVIGLDGYNLSIRYQGACGGCPHATTGTLRAIQNFLRSEVDPNLNVIPA